MGRPGRSRVNPRKVSPSSGSRGGGGIRTPGPCFSLSQGLCPGLTHGDIWGVPGGGGESRAFCPGRSNLGSRLGFWTDGGWVVKSDCGRRVSQGLARGWGQRWGKVGLRKRLCFVLPAPPNSFQALAPGASRVLPRPSARFSRSHRASGLPCAQVHTASPQPFLWALSSFLLRTQPRRPPRLLALLPAPGPRLPEPPTLPRSSPFREAFSGASASHAPQTRNQGVCERRWHRAWPGAGTAKGWELRGAGHSATVGLGRPGTLGGRVRRAGRRGREPLARKEGRGACGLRPAPRWGWGGVRSRPPPPPPPPVAGARPRGLSSPGGAARAPITAAARRS